MDGTRKPLRPRRRADARPRAFGPGSPASACGRASRPAARLGARSARAPRPPPSGLALAVAVAVVFLAPRGGSPTALDAAALAARGRAAPPPPIDPADPDGLARTSKE